MTSAFWSWSTIISDAASAVSSDRAASATVVYSRPRSMMPSISLVTSWRRRSRSRIVTPEVSDEYVAVTEASDLARKYDLHHVAADLAGDGLGELREARA